MKYTPQEQAIIAEAYYVYDGNFTDIAEHLMMTVQAVKRALADQGIIYLSWYKPAHENELLLKLKEKGITYASELEFE